MNQYEAYKVNSLVNQYRANPDMFNDDQLDELEQLAEQHQINFKRSTSPFSLTRAMQQASAGFIEGFTTLDLMPKEPRNTGEAIFRQLGHLAGFAPSIVKAPIVGIAKVVGSFTGKETSKVLQGKITRSVINGIDFIGDKSIPMIAQKKTQQLFQRGLKRTGADTLDYWKRGAKTRAITEEAVGLAGASAVSSIWKGTDAIIDSFVGGAIAGGAFGGIGNFANLSRFHKGNPQQVEHANKMLRMGLGSAVTGLPATLRGEPTEMQIYEYLLGGFFGYNSRPAKEVEAGKWLTGSKRFEGRDGGAEILDPKRAKDFNDLSKEAQEYLLYEHPVPKASEFYPNSEELGGTTGQALGYLQKWMGVNSKHVRQQARESLGKDATELEIRDWWSAKAGNIYEQLKIKQTAEKPPADTYKPDDSMDFNDPVEVQESRVNGIAEALYPSVKKVFTSQNHLAKRLIEHKQASYDQLNNRPLVNNFIGRVTRTMGRDLKPEEASALRKWYLRSSEPVNEVLYITLRDWYKKGIGKVSVDANVHSAKDMKIGEEGVALGEKYYTLPISKLAGVEFQLLTHTLDVTGQKDYKTGEYIDRNKASKILDSYPDYSNRKIRFNVDDMAERSINQALSSQEKYIYSGIKDKNALLIAPLKTKINGIEITKEMIWDAMSNGLVKDGISARQVKEKLQEAFTLSEVASDYSMGSRLHEQVYISNILHHAKINGLIGDTGNIGGLHKMLQAKYATSPSDFNKRMQLFGNRMTPLDPADFADLRPDGNLRVMYIQDKDVLKHMIYKKGQDIKEIESMSDGGILYSPDITRRTLESVGLPDAGHFKPVSIGLGEGGVFATKSNGQLASPAWQKFMKDHGVDAVVMGSAFKVRGEYKDTPIEYKNEQYSTTEPNIYKLPIKDMQVSLSTFENMGKSIKGQEMPLQMWNQMDFEQEGFMDAFNEQVKLSKAGSVDAQKILKEYTKPDEKGNYDFSTSKVTAEVLANRMNVRDMHVKELPLDFVLKHLTTAQGDKKIGALLFNKIHKLDKEGGLEIDTFKAETNTDYTKYREQMDRIDLANINKYDSRMTIHKDHHMSVLKKFIISHYSNPMVHTAGKAWLKAITPDQIPMMSVDPKYYNKKTKKFVKKIREGEVYLDNYHRQMPVVAGNKRFKLGELWDIHTRAEPKPEGITYKAISDALNLVVIRTPADSPSGVRVLRFGGFTNQHGAGAFTHYKDDYYLGGADKDSDSIKIFQGFSKSLRDIFGKNKNAKDRLRPEEKEYNKEYAEKLDREFSGETIDPWEKFYMKGGKLPDNAQITDAIMPKALMFSPSYRMKVAKRSKAGLDGLGNGLSAKVYLQNVADYVNQFNKLAGEVLKIDTPYGKVEIEIRDRKVEGVDRMQYFRDLGSAIVNKSADASSDPTVKNYSHFRDMLFNALFKVKNGKNIVTEYKEFVKLIEASKELKPIVRAIQTTKTNNSFRFIDSSIAKEWKENRKVKVRGNKYLVHKDIIDKLNLHLGERIIFDSQDPMGLMSRGTARNLQKNEKDPNFFELTRAFKPSRPEFVDLEADVKYLSKESTGKQLEYGNSHAVRSALHMAERMNLKTDKNYSDRLASIYNELVSKYLVSDIMRGEKIPKEIRKIIKNNQSILLKHIDIPLNQTIRNSLSGDRNLGLDLFGKTMGQFSTIEQLNRQFINLEKYLRKAESDVSLKKLTDAMYKWSNKVKQIGREKRLTSQEKTEKIEGLIKGHSEKISDKAEDKGLRPEPFLKYYHTMLMSPITGTKNEKGYVELNYSPEIHGSKLIPMVTKQEWFNNYEHFVQKLGKEASKSEADRTFVTAEGTKEIPRTTIEDALSDTSSIKVKKIVEQLTLPFKEPNLNEPVKGTRRADMLVLNKRDAQEVAKFEKFLEENPLVRENFNDFFTGFTYENQGLARNQKDMNLKDVYAMNEFFKRANDPTDLKFHRKYFHWDPRYVDNVLVAKGIGKSYFQFTQKNPVTGEKVDVYKIMSPIGAIGNYNKNVKDRGVDIDSIKLKKANNKLFEFLQQLPDRDATTRELFDYREGRTQGPLSKNAKALDIVTTKFFKHLGDNYIYVKDAKGKRYTDNEGNWSLDKNFGGFFKSTKGRLNQYMHWDRDGAFNFKRFYEKVVDVNLDVDPMSQIIRTVGVDGAKRYQYEQKIFNKYKNQTKYKKNVLDHRQKNPYHGVGFRDQASYMHHGNFNKTEGARREFLASVEPAIASRSVEVRKLAEKKYGKDSEKVDKIVEQAEKQYRRQLESRANFEGEHATIKDIADLGNIDDAVLNKKLKELGFNSRIGALEARTADIQGYDKTHNMYNNYLESVVRGMYNTLSAIHGDRTIMSMKRSLKNRNIPEAEANYFKELYNIKDRRQNRRKGEEPKDVKIVKDPRYKNYVDVWADYIKLHLQTVLGHQTYFPEKMMSEIEAGIDPLYLKSKRNLFYMLSDQNVTKLYEKVWQSNRFSKVPFIKHAPLEPEARKEYFSRKLHDFGRMEAQYELMTLLANTGTYATNIFSGNIMTGASAGIRNFMNIFSKKKVYDRLLTSNGKEVIFTLDGKPVRNRKQLSKWMEEQGILDNFINHEFEYNEGLTKNLTKSGVSIKNFKRDITRALKDKKGKREESVGEVVSRYGVKDIMLKYGSFFMRHSEKVNRVNSYMAHAMQAMESFGPQARELSIADPWIHDKAMKGIENTQFLYQNSFRPMFMRTATGKVLTRFKLFAWNSIRTRREFYKQAKLYGFQEGTVEYNRAKDLFLTDMFMMALGGAFMFSIFDTSLAPPYDWIQALADWMYGDKKERDMAFYGSKLGPANLLKPPIARIPEAMGQILTGDWEQFSGYTAYTLFPFGRMARQVNQLTDDRVGRGLERFPEIVLRFPYNQIQSRIERAKRRSDQSEAIEEILG